MANAKTAATPKHIPGAAYCCRFHARLGESGYARRGAACPETVGPETVGSETVGSETVGSESVVQSLRSMLPTSNERQLMQCPRDGSDLVSENYEGAVLVDRCPTCHGVWLDAGELQTVQETIENEDTAKLGRINAVVRAHAFARQQAQPDIVCPSCGGRLEAGEYVYCSQIMVDRCLDCSGIWLDEGELAALEQFFEHAAAEERDENRARERSEVRRGFFASLLNRRP